MPEGDPNQNPVTELGGNEIEAVIAQSSRCALYEAVQKDEGKLVALKVLRPSAAERAAGAKAFLESAQAVSDLAHPNVVRLLRGGADGGLTFVTMELVDGPSLERLLEREGELPASDVARLLSQGLSALEAAEKVGLRHGRIQPSHCLLAPGRNLKLIGYISSGLEADDEESLPYLSPEEVTGSSPPDQRSDLYSLGATLYDALCGTPPFAADDPDPLQASLEPQALVPPIEEDPAVPVGLSEVLTKMLTREPAQRYQSAAAALEALAARVTVGPEEPYEVVGLPPPERIDVPPEMESEMSMPTEEILLEEGAWSDEGEAPEAVTQPIPTEALTEELAPGTAFTDQAPSDTDQPVSDDRLGAEDGANEVPAPVPSGGEVAAAAGTGPTFREPRTVWLAVMWAGLLLWVCGGGIYFYFLKLRETASGDPGLRSGGEQCLAALNEAKAFEAQRPEDFVGAISGYQRLLTGYPGTVEADEAGKSIDRLRARRQNELEAEWLDVSEKALVLMNDGRHKECDRVLREFQKRCVGTGVQDEVVRFLGDLDDRNFSTIGGLYEKASALDPREDRDAIEKLLGEMEERAVTENLEHARARAKEFRDRFFAEVGTIEGQVADWAKRLYRDYRKEMQFAARVNDHQAALGEVDKIAAEIDRLLKKAEAREEQAVWQEHREWVEADRRSLETVRERWNAGIRKWFEARQGAQTKIGTTVGILDRYEEGRFFLRCGADLLTEPGGMVPAEEVLRLAFPAREVPLGEEVTEKGWWLLYQEDLGGAKQAEKSASALRADTRALQEGIQRWHHSGWLLESLFTGKGSTNPEGQVQLFYDFSDRAQATDWFAVETEFLIVRKAMYPMGKLGDHGCLVQSQLPVTGSVELSMDVTFADAESVVRLGFMRPEGRYRPYHFVELSPGRVGHWVGTHITQTNGNAHKPLTIRRLPVGKKLRVRLCWTRGDTLTLYVEQRQVYVYRYACAGAWMPVIGNREGTVQLDDILIIGKPDRQWLLDQQPALWLAYEKRRREDWIPLFDRKSLNGWNRFGEGEWTVVENGVLRGDGTNATLEIGERSWRNYIVTAKVRIRNGATVRLYLRRDPGADGTADARQFVFSCGAYVDCGIYRDQTYDWFKSRDMVGAWHTHWHELTVSAKADFYNIFIDGRLYYRLQDPRSRCRSGNVAIYTHAVSSWRDLRIKLLH